MMILEGYFDSPGPRDTTIVVDEAEVAAADMWKSKLARKGEIKKGLREKRKKRRNQIQGRVECFYILKRSETARSRNSGSGAWR
jgi:hypothetical protein